MGCCVSVPNHKASTDKNQEPVFLTLENRAPPSAEEETVKEVLSEVSKPKPVMPVDDVKKQAVEAKDLMKTALNKIVEGKYEAAEVEEVEESVKKIREVESHNNEEEMSEVSEICSESVSTTTAKSVADDGGEVRQQRRQRMSASPAKIPARSRVMAYSPSRKSEQSPVKRTVNNGPSVRLVNASYKDDPTRARRVGSIPEQRRRDPGEGSGRRSRSPATTRSGSVNRSPSRRAIPTTASQSPGRVRSDPNERGSRRLEGKIGINKNENNKNTNSTTSTKESLENPLVSLECFIFL